jgi:PAS domain-containing protein
VSQNERQAPKPAPRLHPRPAAGGLDAGQILRSVGGVAYEWRIDTDAIAWSDNALEHFGLASREAIATGRAFAQLVDAAPGQSRFEAVTRSGQRDDGAGVPYQVQYALRPPAGETIWLEDTGRWFAGADGLPACAHGMVRVITERHRRETELERLA